MFALQSTGQLSRDDFIIYDENMYELENKLISMNKSLINKISSNSKWKKDYR